ncbi:cilia- and flagella-associated protein 91 isoform X2 [Sphaeramia orbicularis]|uniref:cilia- and flagella-associated protein 91 isoform X2 n=1 Tax=Sphaeramia orbicularis TaxID=375764 RepID=UPI00117ECEE9|nr:cilia- and flagella-associated protein 91 isoform X2 [Sphaeramia orbicularis]
MSMTRTIPRKYDANKTVRPQRVFDYLYDPVYTVSSEVDHVRASLKAYVSKDRVRKVPEYGSMFSDLAHLPRYTVQLETTDPVPPTIDRRWRGHTEQRNEVLQQLAGVAPNVSSWVRREEHSVTGADCWKYFKCPLIPTDVIFSLPIEEFVFTENNNVEQQSTHCTVAVQTDFRESDAQTDPYSPEYVIQPGTTPSELLTLAALTWGRGLPAGLAEVEMIEWMRAKRAWEASLPLLDDLSQLARRRRMMEEMEAKEWAFREGEIQRLQEARLSVLRDLLKQRDETQKEATNERLNQIHAKKQKDKDTKLHRIHNEYIRSLTKLEAKRRIAEVKLKYQQIRNSPRTHSSVTHRDVYTGRNITSAKKIKTYYCDTYEGLLELEGGLFSSVFKPQVKRPACKVIKDGIKPSDRVIQLLEQYRTLTKEAQRKKKPLKALIKKEKPVPHPVTPTVEEPPEGDEERDVAVIHLQKLLRGRSVQHKMFVGKENHLEFIMELRTVHALQKEEQELQTTEKDLITALKRQGDKHRHKTTQEEVSQAKAVGAELENLFDTLSKELIRLQQERRMHAFMLLAERNRHLREAEESGKRQAEDHKCREEDEIFRQCTRSSADTGRQLEVSFRGLQSILGTILLWEPHNCPLPHEEPPTKPWRRLARWSRKKEQSSGMLKQRKGMKIKGSLRRYLMSDVWLI